MRILLVEDEDVAATMLANFLGDLGYEVTHARNGREAFKLVRTGAYRLVISDWEMPEMTGIELCRRIRQRHFGGYIYMILLTSHGGTRRTSSKD